MGVSSWSHKQICHNFDTQRPLNCSEDSEETPKTNMAKRLNIYIIIQVSITNRKLYIFCCAALQYYVFFPHITNSQAFRGPVAGLSCTFKLKMTVGGECEC